MANYSLKRFSSLETLKAVESQHLLGLVTGYRDYFVPRGVALDRELDLEQLSRVLLEPDKSTPPELAHTLYCIDEMATADGMESLLAAIASLPATAQRRFNVGEDASPADIALQAALFAPEVLERKHAEQIVWKRRSFVVVKTRRRTETQDASLDNLPLLEQSLANGLRELKRGQSAKVQLAESGDLIWLIIRRGDPYMRDGALDKGRSTSIVYRPERFDLVRYDAARGELGVNASTKRIKELYVEQVGLCLFGDKGHFDRPTEYTLEPLRALGRESLAVTDEAELEEICLTELQLFWPGTNGLTEIRRAQDLFDVFEAKKCHIPPVAKLSSASFMVKLAGGRSARTVKIRPPDKISYTRDSDSVVIEPWLRRRGFLGK